MRAQEWSVKTQFAGVMLGMTVVMAVICAAVWRWSGSAWVMLLGAGMVLCALTGSVVLTQILARRLQRFSDDLCETIERMMDADALPPLPRDSEALFDRISQRLLRLHSVQLSQRRRLDEERRALQELVSDIAHQVRTPLNNVQMLTDTLLEQTLREKERRTFLLSLRGQEEKLAFLMEALVKTSRLETGLVHLDKRLAPLYETVAQALSGIVPAAEKKRITVTAGCPDDVLVPHDSRWTAEALYNLLDNAVKYTQAGGTVAVSVTVGEMYAAIAVRDNGPGIPEGQQAQVFQRFYRAPSQQELPGVGIGLYLAREIVSRQGGYIRLTSVPGEGAAFTIMLPLRES